MDIYISRHAELVSAPSKNRIHNNWILNRVQDDVTGGQKS